MKIITFKYNRQCSAVQRATLLSDEDFACGHLFRLEQKKAASQEDDEQIRLPEGHEVVIRGHWQ